MSFHDALETSKRDLTDADKRIGSLLLANPRQAPFMPASEVADRADVHESTVIRFAQKLGFTGYSDMRNALRADSLNGVDPTITMHSQGEAFSLAMVVASQTEVLESLPSKIAQDRIDAVVDELQQAQRIYVMGHGLALPIVAFLHHKLLLSGLRSSEITTTGLERATQLAVLGHGDLLVVVAFEEEYSRISSIIDDLEAHGVEIVLLTEEATLMHNSLPERVLAIPRDRARHGAVVPMIALCYALQYALVKEIDEHGKEARRRSLEIEGLEQGPNGSRNSARNGKGNGNH